MKTRCNESIPLKILWINFQKINSKLQFYVIFKKNVWKFHCDFFQIFAMFIRDENFFPAPLANLWIQKWKRRRRNRSARLCRCRLRGNCSRARRGTEQRYTYTGDAWIIYETGDSNHTSVLFREAGTEQLRVRVEPYMKSRMLL